jgi:hypothetical protein
VELVAREAGWNVVSAAGPMPMNEVAIWAESLHRLDVIAVSASRFSDDEAHLARQEKELRALANDMGATLVLGGGGAWPSRANDECRVRDFTIFSRILRRIGGQT